MTVEELESGFYRVFVKGNRVRDIRTNRVYREAIVSERNLRFFTVA